MTASPSTREARITAVVCTYGRPEQLEKALDSLVSQELGEPFGLLVVDNSPAGGGPRAVLGRHRENGAVKLAVEPRPGLSNARNAALDAAETPFIAFMDDDAVASSRWLAGILAAFDASGERGVAVGGPVHAAWGAERPGWLSNSLLTYLSIIDWGGERRVAGPNEWLAGTNIAFRTEPLRGVGGFAAYLGRDGRGGLLSNEELDACNRLRAHGGDLIYDPAVVVTHDVPAERLSQNWMRKRAAWQAVSDQLMCAADGRGGGADVERFLGTLPAGERSLTALWRDVDDARQLKLQLRAIMAVTARSLAGDASGDVRRAGAPGRASSVLRRLLPRRLRGR